MTGEEQKYAALLKQYWGYDSFRGIQLQIIKSICAGRDTLGLMPTGGGKSITFQVPALAQEGVCIVITPLIALMKDQVQHLKARGIRAAAIYSGMTHNEIVQTLEDAVYGGIKLLYVSPERLASDIFQIKLKHMKVSFITVDEAHCISQWGYDFRPSYLQIAQIRDFVPDAPLLALTATATPEVVTDVQHQLKFKTENVFRMSFVRKNLSYVVRETEDKAAQLVHILRSMPGSAIVYVRSRRHSSDIAKMLNEQGVSATFYHAGLEPVVKDMRQDKWQHDKVRVMVATTAFGMGIDKPDVRLVIHTDCPSSPEAYFQEAGRAGRDGKKAYAVLLYNRNDEQKLRKRVTDTFPDKQLIRDVYDHLAYFFEVGAGSGNMARFEFNIDKFSVAFKHFPVQVNSALHILQQAGYIDYETDPDTKARVKFILTREELYRLDRSTGKERAVIDALLRNYGGLFTDYEYIDEGYVAQEAGLTHDETYQALKQLNNNRIISFIPRKNIPIITYTQDRVEGKDLVIGKEVYERRRERFEQRIDAMLRYMRNDKVCRSRQLVHYFGEEESTDCGICDVCAGRKSRPVTADEMSAITSLLADGKKHDLAELMNLKMDSERIDKALRLLAAEEKIVVDASSIMKN
ncbi:MAG: RecQ family ATP-dependent DNA helicase [Prevotella sp.]|nr:RecQ family ATP-dependent DNA helicase [Prevotella sp.]